MLTIVNEIPKEVLDIIDEYCDERLSKNEMLRRFNTDFALLGAGTWGNVYDIRGYAVKVYTSNSCNEDHVCLKKLQGNTMFPILYAYNERCMVMEKIVGCELDRASFDDEFKHTIVDNWEATLRDAFTFVRQQGLHPFDVHGRNVMLTQDGNLKIVDVGLFNEGHHDSNDYLIDRLRPCCNRIQRNQKIA